MHCEVAYQCNDVRIFFITFNPILMRPIAPPSFIAAEDAV